MKPLSILPIATIIALAGSLQAQWSASPAANLAVADSTAAQAQPKIAPTDDGGCYVSWFDSDPNGSPAFGYDVRLQRLDAAGREQWAHGGVLVADRGFSSTQDYGLDVDTAGNALLAFRDDRLTGTQITAALVDPTGALVWGASGVQLTNTTDFVAAPKITGTSDGNVVVAWTQNSDTRVMKLDPTGAPVWMADVVLSPASNNFGASDLHSAGNGAVIIALQLSGGFTSPRHLFAQKLDTNGALLWGAGHVAVFDGGSLQFGNFPTFVSDGAGGAVFAWYSSSPSLECFAQHVLSTGVEQFAHNGVAVSTDTAKTRVDPKVSFDPATSETFVVYSEQIPGGQPMNRVAAQKFDNLGNRQWTASGVGVSAFGTSSVASVSGIAIRGGVMAFWTDAPSFGQDQVVGARLDGTGATVAGPFAVSSTPAGKSRVQSARSSFGLALTAWQDDGTGNDDILAQNAFPSGILGGLASAASRNGTAVNPTCYSNVTLPAIGTTWQSQIAHTASASLTATLIAAVPATGPILPGIGEELIDFTTPVLTDIVMSSGVADLHSLAIPVDFGFVGVTLATQGVTVDGNVVQLCNAVDITLGL